MSKNEMRDFLGEIERFLEDERVEVELEAGMPPDELREHMIKVLGKSECNSLEDLEKLCISLPPQPGSVFDQLTNLTHGPANILLHLLLAARTDVPRESYRFVEIGLMIASALIYTSGKKGGEHPSVDKRQFTLALSDIMFGDTYIPDVIAEIVDRHNEICEDD
jgi:hypothetical protein